MINTKLSKTKESYRVKFSTKTGGAYVEINEVIESERQSWEKITPQNPAVSTTSSRVGRINKSQHVN
jgi:hypothetical protein